MSDVAMEYKSAAVDFKALGDEGQYEGHFAIIGNVDDGSDVIHEGAFLKTIAERGRRVKVFYAHDWMKLIGPAPEILQEDSLGLYAKGRLTLDAFWGKEAWALMKDNALNEGSIGYSAVKFDYEQRQAGEGADHWLPPLRHIRELKLFEVSPVPLGMNPLTSIQAVKAALGRDEPLDVVMATLAQISDGLKAGRVLSAANRAKVVGAKDALAGALEALEALLAAAEPEPEKGAPRPDHSALLYRRLRAAELALAHM